MGDLDAYHGALEKAYSAAAKETTAKKQKGAGGKSHFETAETEECAKPHKRSVHAAFRRFTEQNLLLKLAGYSTIFYCKILIRSYTRATI